MLDDIVKEKTKIHTRDLHLATYPHEEKTVIVHGVLKDMRHIPIFDVTGKLSQPGIIHHLDVKLLIAQDPLRIEKAEATMLHIPLPGCHETLDTVEKLVGVEIKTGFGGQIHRIMGGKKGCTHLCHLVTVMGQEIVQGWLTRKRKDPTPLPEDVESLNEAGFLVDSCRMWAKGGAKMAIMKEAIKNSTRQ